MRIPQLPGIPTMAALMLAAVLTAWLGIAGAIVSETKAVGGLKMLQDWQELIGGLIAGLGIFAASWNVTRKMRLAAAGREQDKIERELPGLQAALSLAARFVTLVDKKPDTKRILAEFSAIDALAANQPDFGLLIEKMIPSAPDFTQRELSFELFKLRAVTERLDKCETNYESANWERQFDENNAEGIRDWFAEAKRDQASTQAELGKVIEEFLRYNDALLERIRSERKRSDILRREHDRYLNL